MTCKETRKYREYMVGGGWEAIDRTCPVKNPDTGLSRQSPLSSYLKCVQRTNEKYKKNVSSCRKYHRGREIILKKDPNRNFEKYNN